MQERGDYENPDLFYLAEAMFETGQMLEKKISASNVSSVAKEMKKINNTLEKHLGEINKKLCDIDERIEDIAKYM